MSVITLTVGSMTSAIKARKLLSLGGIKAKLIKLDEDKDGCKYALEIKCDNVYSSALILRQAGIEYSILKER